VPDGVLGGIGPGLDQVIDETDEIGSLRRIAGAALPHIRPPRH